jgi:hypothetical protein
MEEQFYNFDCTCFTEGLNGINECVNVYGGVEEIYILPKCEVEYIGATGGVLVGFTASAGATFSKYVFEQDQAEFSFPGGGISLENKTTLFPTSLTINLHGLTIAKRNEIMLLTKGQQELVYIFKDGLGTYWIVGAQLNDIRGARLADISGGTGRLRTDANQVILEFTAELKELPYVVDDALAQLILP